MNRSQNNLPELSIKGEADLIEGRMGVLQVVGRSEASAGNESPLWMELTAVVEVRLGLVLDTAFTCFHKLPFLISTATIPNSQ